MADDVTPAQTASFDQTHAAVGANLDLCIAMYRAELADGHNAALTMAGLAEWLVQASGLDHVGMAEHLAVAVARLAEQPEGDA